MQRIQWTGSKTYESALHLTDEARELIIEIRRTRSRFVRRVIATSKLENLMTTDKTDGKTAKER